MKLPLLPFLIFCLVGPGLSGSPRHEAADCRHVSGNPDLQPIYPDEVRTRLPGIWNDFSIPRICLEGREKVQGNELWLQPPFQENSLYQWKYEAERLMRVPCMLDGGFSCFSGRGKVPVDRSGLEEALGDTLVMVKTVCPERSATMYNFHYRGKTFHSLDEVGRNIGFLFIRYVLFSPDCSDSEQAPVRKEMREETRFYTMEEVIGTELRPEKPVVFVEGFQVPVSFFAEGKLKSRYRAMD